MERWGKLPGPSPLRGVSSHIVEIVEEHKDVQARSTYIKEIVVAMHKVWKTHLISQALKVLNEHANTVQNFHERMLSESARLAPAPHPLPASLVQDSPEVWWGARWLGAWLLRVQQRSTQRS
jgi:hypothetical protein